MLITEKGFLCEDCSRKVHLHDIINVRSTHNIIHDSNLIKYVYCNDCNVILVKFNNVQNCDWCSDELNSMIIERAIREGYTISY